MTRRMYCTDVKYIMHSANKRVKDDKAPLATLIKNSCKIKLNKYVMVGNTNIIVWLLDCPLHVGKYSLLKLQLSLLRVR